MAERDIQVDLVLEIEKYPALYNYNLAEYSRKDITERIWSEISNKTHLSVNDCKEKWRNIRSTFLRTLKIPPSGSKPKKPYYLKDHLSFILPFVKPTNETRNRGNIPPVERNDPEVEEQQVSSGEEQRAIAASSDNTEYNIQSEESSVEEPAATFGYSQAARRRRYNAVDSTMIKYLNKKIEKSGAPKQTTTNQTKMNHFFLSLLSEFDDMTDNQIRSFKIKVLQVIDEIKQGNQLSAPTSFIQSLPSTSRDSFPSTSGELSTFSPTESHYPEHESIPHYSPISSVATPYDTNGNFPGNHSIQNQEIPNTPSPVHVPYDLSNNTRDLSYEEM